MTLTNNDLLRLGVIWAMTDSGDEQVNVIHVQIANIVAQTQTDILDDLQEYLDDLYSDVAASMTDKLAHQRVDIFNVTQDTPEVGLTRIAGMDGTNGGERLPYQAAMTVWFRTNVSRHIGRKFIPLFTEAALSDGKFITAVQNDGAAFAVKFITEYVASNGVHIQAGIYDRSAGIARPIISYGVSNTPRTQRRRRLAVGS